ncbi:MAG: Holliday junction branch migration protein RuvA [Verrucomicrobiota bacterium]|jgi:Holliday junction DNA helicase RuvA|nr:Holliday junction branch migration protein RuvA [Verrucomicrobiota bacterium]MDP6252338.1 Holliday junction branch migration protein RuvA [Verrucomicrobiota bacterium]MDP7178689.1 Holliday junction branch migration protein RuvA [Verrucomicrobiota bacterium]HJN81183.1 Holliday junction branch migration protein RuvA [Verrucomicrobiota bacterium]|tara:strand:+ start:913 stop:1509 length:597 start_codon:yes stop_codon:yes gene_type:complete
MITFLKGKLTDALPTQVVIDVNGIGYEVLIPLSSFEKLPELGQAVTLRTQLVVREDSQTLYGFATDAERELFRLIQGVSGIGPRLALNVLSGMNVGSFKGAIAAGDVKRLSSINGVGKKTAERMVLELKDKLGPATGAAAALDQAAAPHDKTIADTVSALEALGTKPGEAQKAAEAARAMLGPRASVEELVRAALKGG